jgi:hypothetical protein
MRRRVRLGVGALEKVIAIAVPHMLRLVVRPSRVGMRWSGRPQAPYVWLTKPRLTPDEGLVVRTNFASLLS